MSSNYEYFRTILTLNLSTVINNPETMKNVLSMVDLSMQDFELSRKPMEIIPVNECADVLQSDID